MVISDQISNYYLRSVYDNSQFFCIHSQATQESYVCFYKTVQMRRSNAGVTQQEISQRRKVTKIYQLYGEIEFCASQNVFI